MRVVIATDIRLYREGLAVALGQHPGILVVGTLAGNTEVLAGVAQLAPDVVLLDHAMPDSMEIIHSLARFFPECRLLALGVSESEPEIIGLAEAGVAGYVPRDASLEFLVTALRSAAQGELHCSPRIAGALLRRLAERAARDPAVATELPLTNRELEVGQLLNQGLSNKEIATRLGIEVATVKNHIHNLLAKLHVHRRAQAAVHIRARWAAARPIQAHPHHPS